MYSISTPSSVRKESLLNECSTIEVEVSNHKASECQILSETGDMDLRNGVFSHKELSLFSAEDLSKEPKMKPCKQFLSKKSSETISFPTNSLLTEKPLSKKPRLASDSAMTVNNLMKKDSKSSSTMVQKLPQKAQEKRPFRSSLVHNPESLRFNYSNQGQMIRSQETSKRGSVWLVVPKKPDLCYSNLLFQASNSSNTSLQVGSHSALEENSSPRQSQEAILLERQEVSGLIKALSTLSDQLGDNPAFQLCLREVKFKPDFEFRHPLNDSDFKLTGSKVNAKSILEMSTNKKSISQALQQYLLICDENLFKRIANVLTNELLESLFNHESGTYVLQAVARRDFEVYGKKMISYCSANFFQLVYKEYSTRTMQFLASKSLSFYHFCVKKINEGEPFKLISNIRAVFLICSLIRLSPKPMIWRSLIKKIASRPHLTERRTVKRILVTWLDRCPDEYLSETHDLFFSTCKFPTLASILQDQYATYLCLGLLYRAYPPTVRWLCRELLKEGPRLLSLPRATLLFPKLLLFGPKEVLEQLLGTLLESSLLKRVEGLPRRDIKTFFAYLVLKLITLENTKSSESQQTIQEVCLPKEVLHKNWSLFKQVLNGLLSEEPVEASG